jgi:hypothetical protein
VGVEPFSIAAADFDGDGRPDLAVANVGDNTVTILRNNTAAGADSASFARTATLVAGRGPSAVAVADFNGDGKPDLAVANLDDTLSVLLNSSVRGAAGPSFGPAVSFAVGKHPISVAVADFNGDGRPDLVVANADSNTVTILLNATAASSATPVFAPAATLTLEGTPYAVAATDFNADGKPDLAVASFSGGTLTVLINTTPPHSASPQFATLGPYEVGTLPFSIAPGDFNGDGQADLAVANFVSNTVTMLINTRYLLAPAAGPGVATLHYR